MHLDCITEEYSAEPISNPETKECKNLANLPLNDTLNIFKSGNYDDLKGDKMKLTQVSAN